MSITEKGETARRYDWRDAVIVAVLFAMILYYFRQILWTNEYIYGGLDIRRHFFFFRKIAYEQMLAGELPLWIPQIYCGMPLLAASQVTPFYPLDLILMLTRMPLNMVFNWDILIHLLTAQLFSYLFFRRLLSSRMAAVFGSMWFWNVFFLNSITTGDALNIRAMLLVPVVFYFVEAGLAEDARQRDFLFGALALGMQVLCGGLQNTFYTMAAVGAYAVFRLACRARQGEEVLRPALGFAAMVVVGMSISAVQLLPAWEFGRLSVRSAQVEWFRYWAIEPYQLIGWFIPMFEGRGAEHGYFGLAPIVLCAYSLLLWKSPRKYFFLILGALAIIYSFGGNTSISSFLGGLPIVRGFRGPFRGAIFFNFSVFVLAAGMLDALLSRDEEKNYRRAWLSFSGATMVLLGVFVAAAFAAGKYDGFDTAVAGASAVFLMLSISCVFALVYFKSTRIFASTVLLAAFVIDLGLQSGSTYSPASASEAFAEDWSVEFLKEEQADGEFRIAVYDTAHINYFGLFGFESANGHHPFPTTRHSKFLPLLKLPKIASLAGVKYYIVYTKNEQGLPNDPPVESDDAVVFNKLPGAPLPRAFLVQSSEILPGEDVPDRMRQYGFDPWNEVILEKGPALVSPPEEVAGNSSANVVSRRSNAVVVETESDANSILVLAESYYPGWTAYIDGERADLMRANYVFRAVIVPAGKHEVAFRFRPLSFVLGMVFSCVGALGWLGWALALCVIRR